MPLDPSIILGGRPAPIQPPPSPLETFATLGRIEDVRAQVEQRRLAGEAARQKAAEDAAMRQALTDTGGDVEAALSKMYRSPSWTKYFSSSGGGTVSTCFAE